MTQWNTFYSWTHHLWTTVWLTVLAGAVFSNYPFSTVEHFQPCCLHLSLCASRRPHYLILILLMKCNFRIIFFTERTSLYRRPKRKDATIATKLPSIRSALLVHLNTFALICGSRVIQPLQNILFYSLKWWKKFYINNIMNCLLWILHPWLRTAHRRGQLALGGHVSKSSTSKPPKTSLCYELLLMIWW